VNPGLPEPEDPVLRALAEHWEDVLRLASEEQRERLRGLVAGTVEPDPVDARAAVVDELLFLLPPGHPMVEVLRTGTMLNAGVREVSAGEIENSLARLRLSVLPTEATDHPELDEFDRQVQARLLDLPFLSPDELRGHDVDPNDERLIRLSHPDGGVRLPAFQFSDVGKPWRVVQEVNERLDTLADPWGATCWWVDPHARLDAVPADLLGEGHDALLMRAAAAVGVD